MASVRAIDVVTDAYERLNRLSPGETISADDLAFGLRRLNLLVDEWAARYQFLYKDVLTSAAQSGNITLGVGAWAAVGPSSQIVSATQNNVPMQPISMQQFNLIYQPTNVGAPGFYAQDGLSTVYLWPVPNGQTIKLQTRTGVPAFADLTTVYSVPDGYTAGLGASLAVRCAPVLLGNIPPDLRAAEIRALNGIDWYPPAIVDTDSFTNGRLYYPARLF